MLEDSADEEVSELELAASDEEDSEDEPACPVGRLASFNDDEEELSDDSLETELLIDDEDSEVELLELEEAV